MNSVNISGNLTRDPELRQTKGGTPVLSFTVAVSERKKNQQTGQWEDVPNYVDCIAFGNYASALANLISKGSKVAVSGRLHYSSWEKDGHKRSKLEVVADEVVTLSGGNGQKVPYSKPHIIEQPPAPAEVYDEDIHF